MKKMMVLAVLFINSAFGFSDPYQTFLKFINESGSLKMSLEFYQIQYGDHFDTAGDFYYLRDKYYFFDDDILYDIASVSTSDTSNYSAGFLSESSGQTKDRILTSTPYLKPFVIRTL